MGKIDIVHLLKYIMPFAIIAAIIFIVLNKYGFETPEWLVFLSGIVYGWFYKPPKPKG
jgi:hypothetical protein